VSAPAALKFVAFASPKSSSLTPARVSMMLPGLRSRWTMPRSRASLISASRFPLESCQPVRIVTQFRRQNLDRDVTPQPRILGAVNLAHAAGAIVSTIR
jgi:hypothetical protein